MNRQLSDEEKVKQTVAWMIEAAAELNVPPSFLSWNDFQKWMSVTSENKKLVGPILKEINRLGGFKTIKDAHFRPLVSRHSVVMKAEAKTNRDSAEFEAKEAVIKDKIFDKLSKVFKNPVSVSKNLPPKKKFLERHQHLLLSDLHIGSDLDPLSGVRKYSIQEESRSLAKIAVEAAEYKTQYRKDTKLWVNLNGDIIQGKIHDVESADDTAMQVCRATDLLIKTCGFLANNFPEVEINCATGNHDRIPSRHSSRAHSSKSDSYATMIYFAVKQGLASYKNVKFNLTGKPYITYDTFGAHYYGTHGDTHIKLPNPSGTVNVKAIENEINRLNARLNGPKYNLVFCGHVHSGMLLHLTNGCVLVTNPALVPTDEFALSLNIDPDAPTGQWIWESVEGYPIGDSRFLKVTESDRQDANLDKIIAPFKYF